MRVLFLVVGVVILFATLGLLATMVPSVPGMPDGTSVASAQFVMSPANASMTAIAACATSTTASATETVRVGGVVRTPDEGSEVSPAGRYFVASSSSASDNPLHRQTESVPPIRAVQLGRSLLAT